MGSKPMEGGRAAVGARDTKSEVLCWTPVVQSSSLTGFPGNPCFQRQIPASPQILQTYVVFLEWPTASPFNAMSKHERTWEGKLMLDRQRNF